MTCIYFCKRNDSTVKYKPENNYNKIIHLPVEYEHVKIILPTGGLTLYMPLTRYCVTRANRHRRVYASAATASTYRHAEPKEEL